MEDNILNSKELARLEKISKYALKNGLELNKENAKDVIVGLQAKHEVFGVAFCPCLPSYMHKIPDTVCPCAEFKNDKICRCGLFSTTK